LNNTHLYNDIWALDLKTYEWTQVGAVGYIPALRESSAAALVGDIIYIFGGRGVNGCGLGDLCAFRIKTKRWYMFQNMGSPPSPRYGHSLSVSGSKVYVVGGESVTGKTEDTAYVYILDCSKFCHSLFDYKCQPLLMKPI
jgi:N-acetylneuraminic acid mutarotase